MSDIKKIQLGDIAAPGRSVISGPFGSSIGKRFFKDSGIPVIRGNNLTTDFKKFIDEGFVFLTKEKADELKADAIEGDIVFTAAGTIGQVGIIPTQAKYQRYVISNKQLRFRVDTQKAYPNYVYYWLASPWIFQTIINRNTGSTVPLINLGIIKSLPITLPSDTTEQKKIADVLSAIDKKIELNNRINTELEAMAKTLYDYWFVQFDFPDANGKPYKSSGGKMVYNEVLKREIPEGWKTELILDSCGVIDCLHSKKPDFLLDDKKHYLLQLENILDNGQVDVRNKFYVSKPDYLAWTARIEVKHNDIVMTNAGRTAAFAQIPETVKCGIGRNITAIRPNSINPNYFFLSLSGIDIQRQILTNLDHGAFFKSFNVKGIKALKLTRPMIEIENKFEALVSPIIEKRNKLVFENNELSKLRDWLLPMLMNGQVTVNPTTENP
ncbi:restriction endonuclease subunit S [Endozoicomonas gorgoniicola]|uniref:Restriction endonuclease subunit S n=1 Tax=Endozoicomonas gorgoniicola TaxID=1234144 RepID=A0ABT3MTP7_9GAMM|nr:restriction endonuclease subunit S [Endozoicomonas gorgoniicola]MCW7552756.1 restriction endonuclease subunit S [Endozoicomonas gorgoniicola]